MNMNILKRAGEIEYRLETLLANMLTTTAVDQQGGM